MTAIPESLIVTKMVDISNNEPLINNDNLIKNNQMYKKMETIPEDDVICFNDSLPSKKRPLFRQSASINLLPQ